MSSENKTTGFDPEKSNFKMLVYFMDGNERTFYSWLQLDKKGNEASINRLKRYAENEESKIFSAIIYDNISGQEVIRVISPTNLKIERYSKNKKQRPASFQNPASGMPANRSFHRMEKEKRL